MKKLFSYFILSFISISSIAQLCGPLQATCTVLINPDSAYKREFVLGFSKRFHDIQTFALYQLHEASDTIGRRSGLTADVRSTNQSADLHAYDTLGNSAVLGLQTNPFGANGSINISTQDQPAAFTSIAGSYSSSASNFTKAYTTSMLSYVRLTADEVTQNNNKISLYTGLNSISKGVLINIDGAVSNTGPRFSYSEPNLTSKRGIEYAATGYVTQLHSLTDKEYVDKSIIQSFTKTTLPAAALPIRIIFVTDATGGACPAYSDGTNWRRFSDDSIIN